MKKRIYFISFLLALLGPVQAFAGITMHASPIGNGSYLLVGDNVVGVTALDVVIDYDALLLLNPSVEAEGGTVTDIDAGTPGRLFVSINRSDPNAALYLKLRFDNPGRARGTRGINSVTATSKDAGDKTSSASDAAAAANAETGPGNDAMAVLSTKGIDGTGRAGGAPDPQHNANKRTVFSSSEQEKSVLQRFIEFKGEKNLQSFAVLFERSDWAWAKQYPSIAFSDGKTPVTINLEMQQEENGSPDIGVWDATLVSLHKDGAKSWVATVVPSEGVCEAKLIFKINGEIIEFPLVVAPLIEPAASVNEQNFLAALNDYLSIQDASYEKGNILPLSEYIFTANYLVRRQNEFSSKKETRDQ